MTGNCPNCSDGVVASSVCTHNDVMGVYKKCRSCGFVVQSNEAENAQPVVHSPPASVAHVAPKSREKASEPLDVIKAAKERLRFVKGEIRRLRKLEKEAEQLQNMLDAAAGPKRKRKPATVRQLRETI